MQQAGVFNFPVSCCSIVLCTTISGSANGCINGGSLFRSPENWAKSSILLAVSNVPMLRGAVPSLVSARDNPWYFSLIVFISFSKLSYQPALPMQRAEEKIKTNYNVYK
jgi:hypothetical protein